jgi:hypothetical protein
MYLIIALKVFLQYYNVHLKFFLLNYRRIRILNDRKVEDGSRQNHSGSTTLLF